MRTLLAIPLIFLAFVILLPVCLIGLALKLALKLILLPIKLAFTLVVGALALAASVLLAAFGIVAGVLGLLLFPPVTLLILGIVWLLARHPSQAGARQTPPRPAA